jgi:hypothetical protein
VDKEHLIKIIKEVILELDANPLSVLGGGEGGVYARADYATKKGIAALGQEKETEEEETEEETEEEAAPSEEEVLTRFNESIVKTVLKVLKSRSPLNTVSENMLNVIAEKIAIDIQYQINKSMEKGKIDFLDFINKISQLNERSKDGAWTASKRRGVAQSGVIETLETLLNKIFPNEEEYKYFIAHAKQGMIPNDLLKKYGMNPMNIDNPKAAKKVSNKIKIWFMKDRGMHSLRKWKAEYDRLKAKQSTADNSWGHKVGKHPLKPGEKPKGPEGIEKWGRSVPGIVIIDLSTYEWIKFNIPQIEDSVAKDVAKRMHLMFVNVLKPILGDDVKFSKRVDYGSGVELPKQKTPVTESIHKTIKVKILKSK